MWAKENGIEGDDEREEESEEDNSDEEEEEEPRLKYQRMGGSVPTLLQSDAASCIAVSERMIALGTHSGSVHILDFLGNQVSLCSNLRSYISIEFCNFIAFISFSSFCLEIGGSCDLPGETGLKLRSWC